VSVEFRDVSHGCLRGATASFAPGLHVVVGMPSDGTDDIARLVAGVERPQRGSVLVANTEPCRSPTTRRRVGAVFAEERATTHRNIAQWVGEALELRGDLRNAAAFLNEHNLSDCVGAAPRKMPADLLRHVALSLALSLSDPLALALVEPLATGPRADRERTRDGLFRLARTGAVVIVLSASLRDASELGGVLTLLDRGRFVRQPAAALPTELTPARELALRITTPDGRALAQRLSADPAVTGVEWRDGSDEVRVRGPVGNALALAVLAGANELGATILAIEPVLPALDEVRAASVGLWRGAYDAAYRLAEAHARAAFASRSMTRSGPPPSTLAPPTAPGSPPSTEPGPPGSTEGGA
jgi:ABC-type thiamine transport system ATPase subunit